MVEHFHKMGAIDGPDVEAQSPDWVLKVQCALRESNKYQGEESISIFKIPKFLRFSGGDFTPREWRFGLHNRENLYTESDNIKISAAAAFGLLGAKWDDFCNCVVDDPVGLLKSYGLHDCFSSFDENEVKYILALDALLLVLVFDSISSRAFTNDALNSLFRSRRVRATFNVTIIRQIDIALLENQIPMTLLRKAIQKCITISYGASGSDGNAKQVPTAEQTLDNILKAAMERVYPLTDKLKHTDGREYPIKEYLNLAYPIGRLGEREHFLDCVYHIICGSKGATAVAGDYYSSDYIHVPSAIILKASGIKIRPVLGTLDNTAFRNGRLYLPVIMLGGTSGSIFRNLALYESLYKSPACMFSDYMNLIKDLLGGVNDVELLTKRGVIQNKLGNPKKLLKMWIGSSEGLGTRSSSKDFHEMKANIVKHCKSKNNVMLAEFKLVFCSRPWYVISAITVTIVTLATCIQTYVAIMSSNRMKPRFPHS
ncbi:hypothetical protein O6H91_18G016300 [Diphasiastrum complanatum]|uniref:Uncharacterized protein n=1 Tax=Diphasiastrum complanatum TaxID=34168 RepID=A0ACC2AYJ2_DIPCM|nr:hypothetical protein O6H91_18G016300 [Diphasiastrum complanatum]